MVENIKSYILNKLFFPKVVVIDKPGMFYSETSKKYGKSTSRKRQIWHFEDISVNLYLETAKRLGEEKAGELWYKIGKETSVGYLLFTKIKKMPNLLKIGRAHV
jgi:DNA topoisomerase IB